jgi:hypothetical protein
VWYQKPSGFAIFVSHAPVSKRVCIIETTLHGCKGRDAWSRGIQEYRKNKATFHAVPPARVRPPPATLLPLMLRSARIPSTARPAGALARGCRDSPRPRAPLPSRANAQRLGDLAGCQQTPRGRSRRGRACLPCLPWRCWSSQVRRPGCCCVETSPPATCYVGSLRVAGAAVS